MQKKVLVFGTFDGLHKGHLELFKQAREYGNYLIAVVGRDSSVKKVKKRLPNYNERERLKMVQKCKLVDKAMLGSENHDPKYDAYKIIKEIKPDVICLGYDQAQFAEKLKKEMSEMGLEKVQVEILKPFKPDQFKSSLLNK